MARATAPKLTKTQLDIEKMEQKLLKMRSDMTGMTINPRGSDVELCRIINAARDMLSQATASLREARQGLDPAVQILERRKPKK